MRALLVNPWIHDFAAFDLWSKPLGLLTVAACLKQAGVEVRLIDCLDRFHPALAGFLKGKKPKTTVFGRGHYYSEEIAKPDIFKCIPRRYKRYGLPKSLFQELIEAEPEPNIILVSSGMTYWYPGVFEAIGLLRKRFPDIPLILGGIYVRLCPEHARAKSRADFVYTGSRLGEILELISNCTGQEIDMIGQTDLEQILPAYELYASLPYATLRTSRGCPFRCSYCGWYLLEKEFRQTPVDLVVNQIEQLYREQGVRNFSFYDEALLYNAEAHLIKILEQVTARGIKANFHTPNGLHTKYLTSELAELLKQSGFVHPRLGLETISPARQKETGGKTTTEEFLRALGYLKDAGFSSQDIGVNILMGLPGQDFREVEETIRFAGNLGVRIFLEEYALVPGTPDYLKSGLSADADPLIHNNSIFPLYGESDYRKFRDLKDLAGRFNTNLGIGRTGLDKPSQT